jgi:hypothetical protein
VENELNSRRAENSLFKFPLENRYSVGISHAENRAFAGQNRIINSFFKELETTKHSKRQYTRADY